MKIVSMVAIVEMMDTFNLEELEKLPGIEPCLKWVHMRFTSNNYHIAIYKSGKIRVSGVKSDVELERVVTDLLIFLESFGIKNKIKHINVSNYVLVDQLHFNVNLEILAKNLLEFNITYEPEQFPGLIFKDDTNITFLLFNSGKMNITGVRSLVNLKENVCSFKELIYEKSFED